MKSRRKRVEEQRNATLQSTASTAPLKSGERSLQSGQAENPFIVPQTIERRVRLDSGLTGLEELDYFDRSANWNQDKLFPLHLTRPELEKVIRHQGGHATFEQQIVLVAYAASESSDEAIRQKGAHLLAKLSAINQKERLKRLEMYQAARLGDVKLQQNFQTNINTVGLPQYQEIIQELVKSGVSERDSENIPCDE